MKPTRLYSSVVAVAVSLLALSGCDLFVSTQNRIDRAAQKVASADDRGALIDLQNALRSEPENVRAHLLLADVSLRLGDPKAAEQEVQEATRHGATAEQTRILNGDIRLALREFDQLLVLINTGALGSQEPVRSTYRGLAWLGKQEGDKAIEAFTQALAADPNWARARVGLAEGLAMQGNAAAGLKELEAVLAANPKNATAALLKGTLLARRGDYGPAAAALQSARENRAGQLTVSQHALTQAMLTEARLALGDLQQAQAAHAELVQLAPSLQLTHLLSVRLAMVKQDYATAVTEAQQIVTAAPDLVPAKLLLGAALLAQGNLNQAETQLSAVVRQEPENVEARKMLARINLRLQRPDAALQVLSPIQQSDAGNAELDSLLGWANLQLGDDAAAIALLERSAAAQPANAGLKLDLATAYVGAGEHEKAVQLLRSLPSTPGNTRREALLIVSLVATQGLGEARAEIERLVAAAPADVGVLNLASSFYARQGDFARARDLLARASAKAPGNAATLASQARVEMAAGDQKAAANAIAKALAADPDNMPLRLLQVQIAARAGDMAAAGKYLEDIRASDADAVEPRLLLARLYILQKRTQQSDEVLRELRARAQNDAPVADALAGFYMEAGRFEEALSWYRIAAQKDPAKTSYALNVSRAQLALGNNAAARETLDAIVTAHPDSVPAGAALAMLDLRDGHREVAAARVAGLKKAHPDDSKIVVLEGDLAMAGQSYKDAARAYATASRLAPSGAAAIRVYRANHLGGLPDPTAPLEAWLAIQPADLATRMVLAEAYAAGGQRDRAIEQYEKVVAADRPNAMALNNLAWLYHETGDKRAADVAKRAYTAAPQTAAIADTYGWILVKSGDVEQGLPILQKAVADSKLQPDIRYHYAAALAQTGRRDDARRELIALTRGDAKFASAADAQKLLAELGG